MKASDLMVKPAATIRAEDSLAQAATIMRDRNCGAVVVVGSDGHAMAMVTDRDVCLTALRVGRALPDVPVHRAMSPSLFSCHPDDDITRVEEAMSLHQVRRLPVVDASCHPLGVVSLDDIAMAARRQRDLFAPSIPGSAVGRTLGDICRPRLSGMNSEGGAASNDGGWS